jgi:hypothetical protein
MMTYVRLYLAQFFINWEMFQTKIAEKTKKTHIYVQKPFSYDYAENYCTAGQATDDNII